VELISRMMDGSITYDPEGRLEAVSSGRGARQDDKIERLKEVPLFEGCSHRQLRSVAKVAQVFDVAADTVLTRAGEPGTSSSSSLTGPRESTCPPKSTCLYTLGSSSAR
jgi:hypothetical protein